MATTDKCLVCAIDFGTTYTGFAYGTGCALKDIKLNNIWYSRFGLSGYKTSTSVLVNAAGELEEFGFDAEYKYSQLCSRKDAEGIELYKHFKTLLYDTKDISRRTEIKSVRGVPKPAIDVFALVLAKIKHICLETVASNEGIEPTELEMKWVITIPAIWSDRAKFFMREAAFKAGLITKIYSTQLIFALEPEAASLYIHALKMEDFKESEDVQNNPIAFHPGTKYMVVDAGGGTVDVTAHEILSNNRVKELIPASGGKWGGHTVNLKFYQWIETVFGEEFISTYKSQSPHKWLDEFEILFEKKKRSNRPDGDAVLMLPITRHFDKEYRKVTQSDVEDIMEKYKGTGISFKDDDILLDISGQLDLYHDQFGHITELLSQLLEKPQLKELSYIFLVGGFAEDDFFRKAITGLFSSKYKVLTPQLSSAAVMKGAVIFGFQPDIIQARIARKSYGYKVRQVFIQDQHDPNKKILDEFGKEHCDDVFKEVVSAGEEIQYNEERTFSACPFSSSATEVAIKFYSTDELGTKYVDEPHVEQLFQTDLKMEDTRGGTERQIEIKVKFGGTELLMEASDPREGGHKVDMTIDFLCT